MMTGKFEFSRRGAFGIGAGGMALLARPSWAFAPTDSAIDDIVARFMSTFELPGIGVGIVRPGQPPFMRGYGVRQLGRPEPVDADTLFGIASNTKAFTAASIAMLVDTGRIAWDEPVIRYMPDFAMSDPVVTKMMTVRDLLCHRSGLALGAGDLMQFPMGDRDRNYLLHALRYLKLARGFRSGYAYDNILYIVAGILIERVSGMKWEDFVRSRIFAPLRMPNAVPGLDYVHTPNIAGRHARIGPPLRGMGPVTLIKPDETSVVSSAGGIQASVRDAIPWLQTQLGRGQTAGLPRLWSEKQSVEMWTPEVITNASAGASPENPDQPVLQGYALGWFVQDYHSRRLIQHSGGLSGQVTRTALLPDSGIGLVVYSNTEDGIPVTTLHYAILDHLAGVPETDWIASTRALIAKQQAAARALVATGNIPKPAGGPSLPLGRYTGRYRDPWYGDIVVGERDGALTIDFTHSTAFKGPLEPWGPDTFRTHWPKGAGEDAVATFIIKGGHVTGMKMKALSPLADFSYDFHDLVLTRVADK